MVERDSMLSNSGEKCWTLHMRERKQPRGRFLPNSLASRRSIREMLLRWKKKKEKRNDSFISQWYCCALTAIATDQKLFWVEIFREIVVEKIMQPKNDSQTQWLIPICHVSTRTWLLVLSMFHRLTCLSTYLETLTVISSTAMVYPQSPSIASNDFSIYYSFLRPQL